jgi:hypothetical protein
VPPIGKKMNLHLAGLIKPVDWCILCFHFQLMGASLIWVHNTGGKHFLWFSESQPVEIKKFRKNSILKKLKPLRRIVVNKLHENNE